MLKQLPGTAFLTFVGLGLALGSQATISRAFGTSGGLDDYWLAYSICMLATFFVHPFRDAIGAELARRLAGSRQEACERTSSLLSWMTLCFLVVAVVLALVAGSIGVLSKRENLAWMLFTFAIAVPLFASAECLSGLLLAMSRPAWQQALRLLIPLVNISAVVALGQIVGPASLVIGFALAHMLIIVGAVFILQRCELRLHWASPCPPDRSFWRASFALALNAYLVSMYLVLDKFVFNQLQVGAASAFQYAVAVTNVLITLAGGIAATTINPGQLHEAHREGRVWDWMVKMLTILAVGLLVVVAPLWMTANHIVSVLFAGRNFGPESEALTVGMLRAAIFTALPASVVMVGLRVAVLLSAHATIALNGVIVATTGSAVVIAGWILRDPVVVSYHWLAANLVGAAAMLFVLRRLYGRKRPWLSHVAGRTAARSVPDCRGGVE